MDNHGLKVSDKLIELNLNDLAKDALKIESERDKYRKVIMDSLYNADISKYHEILIMLMNAIGKSRLNNV